MVNNQKEMKKTNVSAVFNSVISSRKTTKQLLSRQLRLSFSTISKAVEKLEEANLVETSLQGNSTGGRRPMIISGIPSSRHLVAIDLSPRAGAYVYILDLFFRVVSRSWCSITRDELPEYIVANLHRETLMACRNANIDYSNVIGIGIGLPALYDAEKDIVYDCTKELLQHVQLKARIEEVFGKAALIENDANMAALGYNEHPSKPYKNILFTNFSDGIGMGIVINKSIYVGSQGFAGELGDTLVLNPETNCPGRFEDVASLQAVVRRFAQIEDFPFDEHALELWLSDLKEAFQRGEQKATTILSETGVCIGTVVGMLSDLFNPDCIVIAGDILPIFDLIHPYIQKTARNTSIIAKHSDIRIERASSTEAYIAAGCGRTVFQYWLEREDICENRSNS